MKQIFILLLCIGSLNGPLFAQKTVLSSEDLRFKAVTDKDIPTLQNILHEDLIYVHSNALRESKSDFINAVKTGKIVYESFKRDSFQITQWRKTAVVNGAVAVKGTIQGKPFDVRLRYIAVYRKKKGRWQLFRWQSTKI